MVFIADLGNTEHLSPVRRINDQGLADIRMVLYIHDLLHEHHPAAWFFGTCDIHIPGRSFRIDKQGIREAGSQCRLPDPFRTIDHCFLRAWHSPSDNLHLKNTCFPFFLFFHRGLPHHIPVFNNNAAFITR